jgi:ABC-type antimicrobial peptide transport system permease subunit
MNMQMRSVIPIWLALGAVVFSGCVALISGLYPAMRAMRLSALAAIRNE